MEFIITLLTKIISISFLSAPVVQGMPLLFGAIGELITEKSGHLNLGIPGIMYLGGIGGLTGAFLYENKTANVNSLAGMLCALILALVFSMLGGLIYALLTISFRTNQNVAGLALTTFGIGVGNFLGGSLSRIAGTASQITVYSTGKAFKTTIPVLSKIPVLGPLLFSYGFLTYLAIAITIVVSLILNKTSIGLNLRATGENPAAIDAAGINVTKYKYVSSVLGAGIAGLGGLYFVMEYMGGTWQNNGFGDRGWLAVALVIFALWKPIRAFWGSIVFGGLYILYSYMPISGRAQELFKMLPYVVTIIVLVVSSMKKKKENQPPAGLGIPYFREER
ncbi:MAG: ABC transporter permease [Lachnospiraceae bacterium]|nr:ABC transporter permease [Lachnospiraceae bacterium]